MYLLESYNTSRALLSQHIKMLRINSLPSEAAYGYVCVYVPQVLREELSAGLGAWPLHWVEGALGGAEEELVEEAM